MVYRKINKGGRPTIFTQEVIKKLEEAFSVDATVLEACFYANITPQTYYNNVKQGSELFDRFEALRNNPVMKARKTLVKALDEDPEISLKYLERKARKEFAVKTEVEHSGSISISDLLTNEEK